MIHKSIENPIDPRIQLDLVLIAVFWWWSWFFFSPIASSFAKWREAKKNFIYRFTVIIWTNRANFFSIKRFTFRWCAIPVFFSDSSIKRFIACFSISWPATSSSSLMQMKCEKIDELDCKSFVGWFGVFLKRVQYISSWNKLNCIRAESDQRMRWEIIIRIFNMCDFSLIWQ